MTHKSFSWHTAVDVAKEKEHVFRERQNSVVQTLAVLVPILYTEIQRLINQEAIRTLNPGLAGKNMVEYYW